MPDMTHKAPKAIALISGGLDSMLAAKVVANQGIHVEGVNFFTGFCVEGHTRAIRNKPDKGIKRHSALWSADQINIPLRIEDISAEYKDIVINPSHGYGRLLNPCVDCKIFMVKRALELTADDGEMFDFVVTGEVVGQRPKSQKAQTMQLIARETGAEDRLLRPLSAKNLEPTLPEREGWVDREALYDFSGRSRKPQFELANSLGIEEWSQPAGGCCFLTDESYSAKLQDLWDSRGRPDYDLEDVILLKTGRHLRLSEHLKLIIGREQGENQYLKGFRHKYTHMQATSHAGPMCLIDGDPSRQDLKFAARVLARYSKGRDAKEVTVQYTDLQGVSEEFQVEPCMPHEIDRNWLIGT